MLQQKQITVSNYMSLSLSCIKNRNSLEAVGIIQEVQDVLREVIRGFFKKYDYFDDMALDIYDFPLLLRDMGEDVDVNVIREYIRNQQQQQQSASHSSSHVPSPAEMSSISLSFEDCYYSLLSSVGSNSQDIMTVIRDVLDAHTPSSLYSTSSPPTHEEQYQSLLYGNDMEGYYEDESRLRFIPYQESSHPQSSDHSINPTAVPTPQGKKITSKMGIENV